LLSSFTQSFWASTIDGLTQGAIYALVALGYTLVYGVLRLINFAHSEVFMIGTFATVGIITAVGVTNPLTGFALLFFLLLAALGAAAASGASAVILERIAYRPLRRRGATTLAALISAIGASLFLQQLFSLRFPDAVYTVRVMDKTIWAHVGDGLIRADKVLVVGGAIFMMVLLDRLVNGTRFGRAIRATAQNADTATLMGVDIDHIVMLTFLIGGAMAGVGGMLYVIFFESTTFFVGFVLGIKAFTAAVLGGIGNLRGALLGGLLLGLIEEYAGSVIGAQWKDVVSFSVLILVLMIRPTGLLGESLSKARA
jgi:branched-chain amino acid transport system permease protein